MVLVFDMKVDAVFLLPIGINYRRPILRTNNPLAFGTSGTQRKGNFLKEIFVFIRFSLKISQIPRMYSSAGSISNGDGQFRRLFRQRGFIQDLVAKPHCLPWLVISFVSDKQDLPD